MNPMASGPLNTLAPEISWRAPKPSAHRSFSREQPMSERVEARHHGLDKRPPLASWDALSGQPPGGREADTSYTDPRQVVEDPLLTMAEKREVLASWACDSRAPHDSPSARMLDSGAVVHVREILEALKSLDEVARPTQDGEQRWPGLPYARRGRRAPDASRHRRPRRGQPEDDDDPPPCPVRSRPPGPTLPPLTAAATAPRYELMPDDALGRSMTPDTEPWWRRSTAAVAG
jgi:hypothetical protein